MKIYEKPTIDIENLTADTRIAADGEVEVSAPGTWFNINALDENQKIGHDPFAQ